jgi:hypothetical protein
VRLLPSRLAFSALSVPRSLNRSAVGRDQIASGIRWYAMDGDVIKLDGIAEPGGQLVGGGGEFDGDHGKGGEVIRVLHDSCLSVLRI